MSPVPQLQHDTGTTTPELSVILITPDSFETIRRTAGCIAAQSVADRIELVIVAPTAARIDVDASWRVVQ